MNQPDYAKFQHLQQATMAKAMGPMLSAGVKFTVMGNQQYPGHQLLYPIDVHQHHQLQQQAHHQPQFAIVAQQQQYQLHQPQLHQQQIHHQQQHQQIHQLQQLQQLQQQQQQQHNNSTNNTHHHQPQQQQLQQSQQQQPQQQQLQLQLMPSTSSKSSSAPDKHTSKDLMLKDQTNFLMKNLKEKYISHFIDGQWIIETSKPLTELKIKSAKKKKKLKQLAQQKQQQQHSQPQPQAQTQIQPRPPTQTQLQATQVQLKPQLGPAPLPQALPQPHSSQQQPQQPPLAPSLPVANVQKLRAEMPNWSVENVVKFIEKHEAITQYASRFAEDEIDGGALLCLIDGDTITHLLGMFKRGPALKLEAILSKYKLNNNHQTIQ